MLITAENLNFGYEGEPLLEGLCFTLNEGERVGVVGGNGEGKTTLIRLILGELSPDGGTLFKKNGIRIGYLAQNGGYDSQNSAYEEMRGVFAEDIRLLESLSETEEEIARCDSHDTRDRRFSELSARYENLTKRVAARDSYNFEVKLKTVLNGMGFAERYEQKISTMSGGEKTRLKLCRLLLEEPDLLILDEPTNHLDIKTVFFLEDYLASYKGALFTVSHDRFFLDRTVKIIYEIENKRLSSFKGNYTAYKKLKADKIAREEKEYEAYLEETKKLQAFIDKNRVRATSARAAQDRVKKLEALEVKEKPFVPPIPPSFSFTYDVPSYENVLDGENFCIEAGGKILLSHASFSLRRGDKCAIVGENGTGKSTLVKEIVRGKNRDLRLGRFVRIGYYDQENAELNGNETVLSELWGRRVLADQTSVRKDLARAGLSAEDVYKNVSSLSGGERAKLALAVLENEHGNFLILDEPTNHLDLPAREALEKALQKFDGTLLIVSHDRYFIEAVAGEIAEIENQSITLYRGGYEAYLAKKREAAAAAAKEREEKEKAAYLYAREQKKNASHQSREERAAEAKRRQKTSEIEKLVAALEAEEAALTEEISTPEIAQNYSELQKRCARLEEVHKALDAAYAEYEKYI